MTTMRVDIARELSEMADLIVAPDAWEALLDAGPEGVQRKQTLAFHHSSGVARVLVDPRLAKGAVAGVSPLGVSLVKELKRHADGKRDGA